MSLKNLKKLREDSGLSQARLGACLGVSGVTIYKWESGKNEPDIEMLCKIADHFDITVDYLLGRTDARGYSPRKRLHGDQMKREAALFDASAFRSNMRESVGSEAAETPLVNAGDQMLPGECLPDYVRRITREYLDQVL